MNAKVTVSNEIRFNEIMIGKYTLSEIFNLIYTKTSDCILDISIERSKENPVLDDIDAPLHGVLNIIEELRGF